MGFIVKTTLKNHTRYDNKAYLTRQKNLKANYIIIYDILTVYCAQPHPLV